MRWPRGCSCRAPTSLAIEVLEAVRAVLLRRCRRRSSPTSPAAGCPARACVSRCSSILSWPARRPGTAALDPAAPEPSMIEHRPLDPPTPGAPQRLEAALHAIVAARGPSEIEWVATADDLPSSSSAPSAAAVKADRRVERARARGAGTRPTTPCRSPGAGRPGGPRRRALPDGAAAEGGGRVSLLHRRAGDLPARAIRAPPELAETFARAGCRAAERLAQPDPTLEAAIDDFVAIYGPLFGAVQPSARRHRAALADCSDGTGWNPAPLLPRLLADVPSAATRRARRARAIAAAPSEEARRPSWPRTSTSSATNRRAGTSPPRPGARPPARRAAIGGTPAPPSRRPADARAAADAGRARGCRPIPAPNGKRRWPAPALPPRWPKTTTGSTPECRPTFAAPCCAKARASSGAGCCARRGRHFLVAVESDRRGGPGRKRPRGRRGLEVVEEARRADEVARAAPPSLTASKRAASTSGSSAAVPARAAHTSAGSDTTRRRPRGRCPGDVLVARTLLPTELPLLSAAALVVETGGPLDHVAAQARERGIPAVVGAADA